MAITVKVGDRVVYTRTFLESGAVEWKDRHAMASRRGSLIALEGAGDWLAHVVWDDGNSLSATINSGNICKLRSVAAVEACYPGTNRNLPPDNVVPFRGL
jgi:hypothetical protein